MVDYFTLDPTLANQYMNVSRWVDWPHRGTSPDVGIDLVAQDRTTGGWTAIQCKFFSPTHPLQKHDIDSFFTASGKKWDGVGFTNRIIISTTTRSGPSTPRMRWTTSRSRCSGSGWTRSPPHPIDWVFTNKVQVEVDLRPHGRYALRPHQTTAIDAILAGFGTRDRGQWISACGTGKTFTSLKLAEQMAAAQRRGAAGAVPGAVDPVGGPDPAGVDRANRDRPARQRRVLGHQGVPGGRGHLPARPAACRPPPTPPSLHERLQARDGGRPGLQVVFSTYQSLDVVARAQALGAADFDLILCDEAHRTTGVTLAGEDESSFVKVHDASYLRGGKRLYMTATPRMFGEQVKDRAERVLRRVVEHGRRAGVRAGVPPARVRGGGRG